jgi:uncharacterized protein (TIGR02466 family)
MQSDPTPVRPADALVADAQAHHRAGRLADAGQMYDRALALDPEHGLGLHWAGLLACDHGQPVVGLALFDRALASGYRSAALLEQHGVLLLQAGRADAAAASLRDGAALDPASGSLWFNLGMAERQAGRGAPAGAAFARAATILDTAAAHFALGLALQETGCPAAAAAAYAACLARNPRHAAAALNAGVLTQHRGDLPGAMALYRQALAADPASTEARANLAAALQESGEDAAAAALFRAILAKTPGSLQALNGLGTTLRALGDDLGALALFQRAVAIDPFHRVANGNLTDLLLDHGRAADAVAHHRACADSHPADARAWLALARILARTGDPVAEADALAQAIACDPGNAEAHHRLGDLAQREHGPAAAIAHYQAAIALAPGRPEPLLGLALAALKLGDGAAAAAACDAVLAADRFDQSAIAYRILALRQLGDTVQAEWLADLERLPAVLSIAPLLPDLAELADALRAVPSRIASPSGQSIRGGTQTQNELLNEPAPAIQALRAALGGAVGAYLAARPRDNRHPFLAAVPAQMRFHSWSVVLTSGGHHVPHIHPAGCISGVLYVAVPPLDSDPAAGCLELGRPGIEVKLDAPPPLRLIRPQPGMLVLFPSYVWHGTRPFAGAGERITVAFDVLSGAPKTRQDWW